ncbi:hypothetical protein BH23ACT9_BH23ACT9_02690 [soil metagenome]
METSHQAAQLHELRCGMAQGNWFCRPTDADEVARLALRLQPVHEDAANR